jgi:hypothetical protein
MSLPFSLPTKVISGVLVCTPQNSVLLRYNAVTMDNQNLMFQGKILFSFWRAKMPKNNKSLKMNCVSISLLSHIITSICGAGTYYCEILNSLQLLLSTYIQIFFWPPCSQTPPNPSYRARDQVSHPHDTRKITQDSSLHGLHPVSLGKLCSAFQKIIMHLSSVSSTVKKLCRQNTWIFYRLYLTL